MWTRRSHTLSTLTIIKSIKNKFEWAQVEQDVFDEIMHIVARDIVLNNPDFNETFKIHTDASVFKLGAVNIKKGKPIALHIRKLTDSQKRYTVTDI